MKNLVLVSLLLGALSACSVAAVDPVNVNESATLDVQSVSSSVVSRYADGSWISSTHLEGYQHTVVDNYSVWIDASVQNLAYNKTMGVIWTVNNWSSSSVSYGHYKGTLPDGTEKWGLDIGSWDERYYSTFQYCIFVTMNGQTWYDNNNTQNYTITF